MVRNLPPHSSVKTISALTLSSLLLLFSSINTHGSSVRANIFIYAGCSQEKFQPSSPFEANLNSFLASLLSSSSQQIYNSFAVGNGSSTPPEGTIYGLYQCRGDLQTTECSKCIETGVNQIGLVCSNSYGASLQLEGCYIRYEHVDFLGKQDDSLRYKKCSTAVSDDAEFFRRRDDVLSDLQAANGFRVSTAGLVEGYAQCLGDLAAAECSSCVADAVAKLKNVCGAAAAAHVFLAQCYARYWASGYYDSPADSSNEDQVGKSVAIIVGALAGLAVLVVLLSFCKKAAG